MEIQSHAMSMEGWTGRKLREDVEKDVEAPGDWGADELRQV